MGFLPQLNTFINNPWFGHFCALAKDQQQQCHNAIFVLPVTDRATEIIREQTIGEYRAYDFLENISKNTLDALVAEAAELQKQKDEPQ